MCSDCVKAVEEVFPEVPDSGYGDFLMNTTSYPFGNPAVVKEQLLELKSRMKTTNYKECYGIASEDMDKAYEAFQQSRTV